VGRIVVIDAEGNSVPFIKGLQADGRAAVTRLRPSLMKGKRIFNRNNFRAYRDGDRVRSGLVDLNDPEADKDAEVKTFRMRVVELERGGTGEIVYLGASTLLDVHDFIWTTLRPMAKKQIEAARTKPAPSAKVL